MKHALILLAAALSAEPLPTAKTLVNSLGMTLVRIEPGAFRMGESATLPDAYLEPLTYPTRSELMQRFPTVDPARFRIPFEARRRGDYDERPVHPVRITQPFYLAATEVTNAQYEQFDPAHRTLRGRNGFCREANEAVVFVSWQDALAFCDWLTHREGIPYRLPTEAEWEYAARAGTTTLFHTGDELPAAFLKNARSTGYRSPSDIVPLFTGRTPANPWGLYDVHGNVEEWVADWYSPYSASPQSNPAGPAQGDFKVTRGGSHGTDPYYLRSANRGGAPPETRNWLIGFRVAVGRAPALAPPPAAPPARAAAPAPPAHPSERPFFQGPRRFVRIPPNSHGPLYSHHNHDTAIAECPNGDLLAIWYTCEQERGREVAVASARLRRGAREWDPVQPFWDTPDRNDHCPALWYDGRQTLYHINGLAAATRWEPLAIILRTSTDSGRTWSPARYIVPEFGFRNMVGQPVFRLAGGASAGGAIEDGAIAFGADAAGGSTLWITHDEGKTWNDPGGTIRGVHAGVVQLHDGRLLALGRGQDIGGWMPRSVSADMGRTWTYSPSPLPPIGGGQRLVLMRLQSGALFYAGFARDIHHFQPLRKGEGDQRGATSLFAALSYDEGQTWPVRRIVTGNRPEHPAETIDGGLIRMSPATSEMQGYLAATQARDGAIHLISSISHYAFNRAWLEQPQPPASRDPKPQANPRPLFTIDVDASSPGEVELWDPHGALVTNHYLIPIRAGKYRILIRPDTAAQIYLDNKLVNTLAAGHIIDWRLPARGRHLETRGGAKAGIRE